MPSAPVAGPANAALFSRVREVHSPAGIGFERIHYKFWREIRIDNYMHVVSAHVDGDQGPVFVRAHLPNRGESNLAVVRIHFERQLRERGFREVPKSRLRFPPSGSRLSWPGR